MSQNKGLTTAEVIEKQKLGKNEFQEKKKKSILALFMGEFLSPLILLLTVASIISFCTGEILDGAIIIAVVLINCIIGTVQQVSAEKSVEKLKKMSVATAIVIRDGKEQEIPSTELVCGDYVILEAGRIVPADLRLVNTSSLRINESALTGESIAAEKDCEAHTDDKTPVGDRTDMAFMTTLIEYGRGEGIVEKIGEQTEIGKISKMLNDISDDQTPLQKNLNKISMVLGIAGVVLCILMFVCQIGIYKTPFLETLMISIAFAVAVIPEGLATVVTMVLTMGIKKMSEKNAIVKQIHAVETLGAVNVICSDKTGTLTQNRMTVVKWFYNGEQKELTETKTNDPVFMKLLAGFCLCNDSTYNEKDQTSTGDPTEVAFIKYASENQFDYASVKKDNERFDEIPFDSDRKMMTTLHKAGESSIAFTKGAIDSIITRCDRIIDKNGIRPISNDDVFKATSIAEKMSSDALRVLALAYREGDEKPQEENMIFIGLAAMIDPPKPGVKETIAECHGAGIDVAMITGDHKITAFAIAKDLNIATNLDQCISGQEIDEMPDEEFKKNILNYRVFARVSPEHKVKIVQAFKSHDKIVSMTGDGVNDAPSLKAADVGASMGIGGTEVAKDAADMILVDDNFITIKNAVEEGRNLFANIKKSISYLLRANFGEVVLMASAIFSGAASPLSTIQILWINLLTDTVPSLALGMDKGTKDVMNDKPRDVKKGILNKHDYVSIVIQGALCGITALIAFLMPAAYQHGFEGIVGNITNNPELLQMCRTYCFTALIINELLMAYVCKSPKKPAFLTKESWNNKLLNISTLIGIGIQIGVLYVTPMRNMLRLSVVGGKDLFVILGIAVGGTLVNAMLTMWHQKSKKE